MNRTLRLKRERLVELDVDQLAAIGGGEAPASLSGCLIREMSMTLCGPSHCSGC